MTINEIPLEGLNNNVVKVKKTKTTKKHQYIFSTSSALWARRIAAKHTGLLNY